MPDESIFDVAVIGGGPAGATAARDHARRGRSVALIDKAGRIKPCGGAIPPRLIRDFGIPDRLLKARVSSARMISPRGVAVDMPIDGGFVGMVDRCEFDEWLRDRAVGAGAVRVTGAYEGLTRDDTGVTQLRYRTAHDAEPRTLRARLVIGADGALSQVGRQEVPGADRMRFVFAYHEVIATPPAASGDPDRCEIHYRGALSPDFYAWVFPHGGTMSVGSASCAVR